jgi:hypothetical protein
MPLLRPVCTDLSLRRTGPSVEGVIDRSMRKGTKVTRLRKGISSQDGTAMVELALVLPILLFLALGIVDFGKAINYWNDANQMAADAARFAAVNHNPGNDLSTPVTDFRQWVRLQAETGELKDSDAGVADGNASTRAPLQVCVSFPDGSQAVGHPVKVEVKADYDLIPWLRQNTQVGKGSVTIKGSAVMRIEQAYTMQTGCAP